MKKRLPLLIALGFGVLLWKTGVFGLMASERVLTFRFPVSYSEVRWLELQVWDGESLLSQQERNVQGLSFEPEMKLTLARGPHKAIGRVLLAGASEPQSFASEFDPGLDDNVVLEMKKP
ncbi:MAG: hypothetical protein JNM17_03270 [Archangium sp.]|nr:hypothetical protein [Archangium sp.]